MLPSVSLRRVCRALEVSRSSVYLPEEHSPTKSAGPKLDEEMAGRVHELVKRHPTFGYRRLWALLRHGDGLPINRKRVHRLVKSLKLQVKRVASRERPGSSQPLAQTVHTDPGVPHTPVQLSTGCCGGRAW